MRPGVKARPRRDGVQSSPPQPTDAMPHVLLGRGNVLDPDLYPNWAQWPTQMGLAAILKVDQARAQQIYMRGELARWECPDGTYRFEPEQVESYRALSTVVDGYEPSKPNAIDTPEIVKESQKQAIELLKQSHGFIEKLLDLVPGAVNAAMKSLQDESIRLQAEQKRRDERIVHLEEKVSAVQVLQEEMLDRKHERELVRQSFEHGEKRKSEAWTKAMEQFPGLFAAIEATIIGRDPGTKARIQDVLSLLHGPHKLDPEVVEGLLEMEGILTPEQKAILKRVVKPPEPGEGLNGQRKTEPAEKEAGAHQE